MLNRKNAQGFGVLAALHTILGEDELQRLIIGFYRNGREEGFTIQPHPLDPDWRRMAVFAENRNSDQIVLYTGFTMVDFDMNGIPTDGAYKRARYFEPMAFERVARAVDHYLKTGDILGE